MASKAVVIKKERSDAATYESDLEKVNSYEKKLKGEKESVIDGKALI